MSSKPILIKPKQKKFVFNTDLDFTKNDEPIIPMSKVCTDVIKKLQTQPYPQLALATHSTISEALQLYYNQYIKLFKQNQFLNDELAIILIERNSLADQFNQIKKMKSYDDNIRRRRRYASQIERNYHCPMPKCNKGYGSEGSLTHHVRLKHSKFFQSGEYQIYLQTYILPKQQIKNQDDERDPYVKVSINIQQGKRQKRQQNITNYLNLKNNDNKNRNIIQQGQQKLNIDIDKTEQYNKKQILQNDYIPINKESSQNNIQQNDDYMNVSISNMENNNSYQSNFTYKLKQSNENQVLQQKKE